MSTKEIIKDYIENDLIEDDDVEVSEETSLFRDQLLDSLNLLSLITFIEKQFQIKISPSEVSIDNIDTINNIAAFVERKLG